MAFRNCKGGNKGWRDCEICKARHAPICVHLDREGLDRFQSISSIELFPKRTMLCRQDVALDRVLIVTDGLVKLFQVLPDGEEHITGFLSNGDHLGSLKRSAEIHSSAQALTDVIACVIDQADFLDFLRGYPEYALGMLIVATDEIEALHDHIVLLGRKRASERLAAFLLMASERWNHNGADPGVNLPIARTDIASYLGVTPETLSRVFRRLEEGGLIGTSGQHTVEFRNVPALYDLAGFHEVPARDIGFGL